MGSEIRLGQLIAPFGPGSIYTDKRGIPTLVCGLDHWYKKEGVAGEPIEMEEAVAISLIIEPRLTDLLKVTSLRQPPKNMYDPDNPALSGLKIPGHRFPRWYINKANGQLKQFNLDSIIISDKGSWKPVRFIAVCQSGHMSDFPWKEWSGCICNNDGGLTLKDSGGVDLTSIKVSCTQCHKGKTLVGATFIKLKDPENGKNLEIPETGLSRVGINCTGERPWLGEKGTVGQCNSPLVAVLINQSNIYFGRTIASIFLPDLSADPVSKKIQEILSNNSLELTAIKVLFSLGANGTEDRLRNLINENWDSEVSPTDEQIINAYDNFGRGTLTTQDIKKPEMEESELLKFRRAEYNVLRNEVSGDTGIELRIVPADVPIKLQKFFSKVNLVERLRETRVFYGFDRLDRAVNPLKEMPELALKQLFLQPPEQHLTWLPAVKNYGEGIYLELSEPAIQEWIQNNSVWLEARYDMPFIQRMARESMLLPPSANVDCKWAARYQLVHSLSHILINQLVFECGYSSAALKERLFVSSDALAPMAGILIYTASGDADGSLGGLVRMGRPELFETMIRKAISRASWCSADPVCSENLGGDGSRLINMAACHACTLLPETACETINNGLDRAAVVGTPTEQDKGFLSELITYAA